VKKHCPKCDTEKDQSDFSKDKSRSDGIRQYCKSCAYDMSIAWNRSPKGVAVRLWHKHKARSIDRGHDQPDYDRDWLINYVLNHPDYSKLYKKYVASGFDKYECPSIDRIDDNVGYRKDNIRLVSFRDNMDHCYLAARKAEHFNRGWEMGCMRPHHAVVQLTKGGELVGRYISVNEACRQTGANNSKIPAVCSGKRKSHMGYIWMYEEDYDDRTNTATA